MAGALEGEELTVLKATAGKTSTQKMATSKPASGAAASSSSGAAASRASGWSWNSPCPRTASTTSRAAFTLARDYAIVQLCSDDEPLGEPLDLYNYPDVITSGEVALGQHKLAAGKHRLGFDTIGAMLPP